MSVVQLRPGARLHAHLREKIKDAFGLDESDPALADTLDGESDFKDMCAKIMREGKAREAMAKGLGDLIKDMQARKKRLLDGYEKARFAVAEAMLEAGETSIKTADLTISARMGFPEPYVRDTSKLEAEFRVAVVEYEPDFDAINAEIAKGYGPPVGVEITNPQPLLTVRTK